MDIQVISFLDKVKEMDYTFKDKILDGKEEYRRGYYRIQQKKVEVIFLDKIEVLKEKINKNAKKIIIVIDEINNNNEDIICGLIKNRESLIITGKCLSNKKLLKNVIVLRTIEKNELIDLETLIMLLNDERIFNELKYSKKKIKIIIGKGKKESIASQIVISTLNEINDIGGSEEIEIYILGEEELNLKVLANIEDPIRDYLFNSKLRIKQREQGNDNNYINYLVKYNI